MSSFVLDLDTDFKVLGKTITDIKSNIDEINTAFKGAQKAGTIFEATLTSLGKSAVSVFDALDNISAIGIKLSASVAVYNAATKAMSDWKDISGTLDFAEAVTGSSELKKNIQILDTTTNSFLKVAGDGFKDFGNKIGAAAFAALDTKGFRAYAAEATSAFAAVEQAAYRTSTVLVGSNQRSIDVLDKTISSMRALQAATGNSLDSITLLNAQYEIASSGFASATDNFNVGAAAINLNTAGFGNLTQTTNALVKVLNALGEGSEEANLRAAQLFATTKVGLTTIPELSAEVGTLASLGKQLGLDFSDVSAALAVLTTQGLSTSESATALTNFLLEVSSGSEQAQAALAGFADEAGKPIQLNAQSLKNNGISGIVKQLSDATGGKVQNLQSIFSNQSSQQAAQLLIGAGTNKIDSFQGEIKNADPSQLAEESANRVKTLQGAFEQSANKSRTYVESLGQGLKDSVLDRLIAINEKTEDFAASGAVAFGQVAGSVDGFVTKIKAVGGFIVTAFSSLAPIALFSIAAKYVGTLIGKVSGLINKFKEGRAEGESWWDYLYRSGVSAIARLKTVFDRFLADVRKEVAVVKADVDGIGRNKPAPSPNLTETRLAPQLPEINVDRGVKFNSADVVRKKVGAVGAALNQGKQAAFSFVKNGLNLVGSTLIETTKYLGGIGFAMAAFTAAFAIGTGWLDTFVKMADTRTIPAIQELRGRLEELSYIDSIKTIVDDLDTTSTKLQETNLYAEAFSKAGAVLAGAWSEATGQATQYRIVVEQITEAQNALQAEIAKQVDAAKGGAFVPRTDEERTAERKVKLGVILDTNDEAAIKSNIDNTVKAIDARINEQKKKIDEANSRGGIDRERVVAALKQELESMEKQAAVDKETLKSTQERLIATSKLNELNNLDTTVPLRVQLQVQSINQAKAQIDTLRETFGKVFDTDVIDPQKFNDLLPQLQSTLDGLKLQVAIDPNAAAKSFEDLKNIPNFDKLLFSDINAQKAVSEFQSLLTDAVIQQSERFRKSITDTFNSIQQLTPNNAELNIGVDRANLENIDNTIKIISAEYNAQTTSLARQAELAAELGSLEGQRAQIISQLKINEQLGDRKRTLVVEQELLSIQQQTVNLFNNQSKFGSLSVTLANARLDAAKQELVLKKEQVAIESREAKLKAQAALESLKQRKDALTKTAIESSVNIKTEDDKKQQDKASPQIQAVDAQTKALISNENSNFDSLITTIEQTSELQIKAINESAQANIENKNLTFSETEQNKISDTLARNSAAREQLGIKGTNSESIKKELFKGENIKIDAKELVSTLNKTATESEAGTGRKILDSISNAAANTLTAGLADTIGFTKEARNRSNAEAAASQISTADIVSSKLADLDKAKADILKGRDSDIANVQNKSTRRKEALNQARAAIDQQRETAQSTIAKVDSALEGAFKDVAIAKSLENLRGSFSTFAELLQQNRAIIEAEYASRERLISINESLAASFDTLISSSGAILDGTSLQEGLENFAAVLSPAAERLKKDAEQEIASINQTVQTAQQQAVDATNAYNQAKAVGVKGPILDQFKQQASNFGARAEQAKQESVRDINFVKTKTDLDLLNVGIKQSINEIQNEIAAREKQVERLQELSDAFSALGSAAGSVFSNTNIGAALTNLGTTIADPVKAAVAKANNEIAKIQGQKQIAQQLIAGVDKQIDAARKNGAAPERINQLEAKKEDIRNRAETEIKQRESFTKQGLAVNFVTANLQKLGSQINETVGFMQKYGDIIKNTIQFEVERQRNNAEFNNTNRSLRGSLLDFFGDNNPFAEALKQQNQIAGINDQSKLQKTEAIADSRQKLIDLSIQNAQLALEQKGYENSLTQTAILSDLLAVSQGRETKFTGTGGQTDQFINKLPEIFKQSQQLSALQQGLVGKQLSELPRQLSDKLSNIDATNASSRLDALSGNLNPANTGLIIQALKDVQNLNANRADRAIDTNAGFSAAQFSQAFDTLTSSQMLGQTGEAMKAISDQINRLAQPGNSNSTKPSQTFSINATVPITLTMEGNQSSNTSDLQAYITTAATKAVNTGLDTLSKKLLTYASQ